MAAQTKAGLQSPHKQRILILGGGFGGVKAALHLVGHHAFEVTLLSETDRFRYYPSLYRTATGGSKRASSIPLSEIFAGKPVNIVTDVAQSLDRSAKTVTGLSKTAYPYDTLIVALGVVTNFFNIKGLRDYAYGIKTNDEAKRLRHHLHEQLLKDNQPDLNYVVIGGGPTGVELAGVLPGYIHQIMKRHGLSDGRVNVDLVEANPRVLPRMPLTYSTAVQKRLKNLGVELHLGQSVQAETADSLMVSGQPIASRTVVWTAGVTNHPFLKANQFRLTEHGKAVVDQFLQNEPDIYVIGDNADTPHSGLAQTALHDGRFLAWNLIKQAKGKKLKPYKPRRPVYVTPVGTRWAAVSWGHLHIYGWLGWLLRSAADFVGYHDLEPWWLASKHWMASNDLEQECPLCAPAKK